MTWDSDIANSDIIACYVTSSYLRDARCWCQKEIAREQGKSFVLILDHGVNPGTYFEGCNILAKETLPPDSTLEDVKDAIRSAMRNAGDKRFTAFIKHAERG